MRDPIEQIKFYLDQVKADILEQIKQTKKEIIEYIDKNLNKISETKPKRNFNIENYIKITDYLLQLHKEKPTKAYLYNQLIKDINNKLNIEQDEIKNILNLLIKKRILFKIDSPNNEELYIISKKILRYQNKKSNTNQDNKKQETQSTQDQQQDQNKNESTVKPAEVLDLSVSKKYVSRQAVDQYSREIY